MRRYLFWGACLIGGYLVLANYTGFGKDLSAAGSVSSQLIRDLQGR